jgi:hypothetical protein
MDLTAINVDPAVKKTGANIIQYKQKGHTERYWFDDQCTEDGQLVTAAVKTFRSRNDDNSRRK